MYVLLEFYADGEFKRIYGIYPTLKSAETAMKYKENNTGYEVYFQIHIGIMRNDLMEMKCKNCNNKSDFEVEATAKTIAGEMITESIHLCNDCLEKMLSKMSKKESEGLIK